jgi:sulfide:quinone oxidoreductase
MTSKPLTPSLSVSGQITLEDVDRAAADGVRLIISNRPDGEEPGQLTAEEIGRRAAARGVAFRHIPVSGGVFPDEAVAAFREALDAEPAKTLAFCRSGMRAATLWALAEAGRTPPDRLLRQAAQAGYDLSAHKGRLAAPAAGASGAPARQPGEARYDVIIIGGGSGGVATAASILRRDKSLSIAIVEPRDEHFYQPGWTMVGAGVFEPQATRRPMADVIPKGIEWIRLAARSFEPQHNAVVLDDGRRLTYRALVVSPGNRLDWDAIDGLTRTLGRNGVTSNYRYDTAPYTRRLAREMKEGVALFTQPPMPIKCAGAPQKAMYLTCDAWRDRGVLGNIKVEFHNAGGVLFGVKEYVPALMRYIDRYGVDLHFESNLVAVDGEARRATFREAGGEVTRDFDMLHVVPVQKAPQFIADSPLADAAGYVEVDPATLQHVRHPNIFGLGDGASTPNAKTAAAVRKQAPIVAVNLLSVLRGGAPVAGYDGYGSCPLTVERGKIVLAEFGYGGKLLPTFPKWLIDGRKPQRLSWLLKSEALPFVYWNGMLKGREWLVKPAPLGSAAQP